MDTTILVALIALFGTLITVYVGYLQWKSQRAVTLSSPFQEERYKVYKRLWGLLPEPASLFESESHIALSPTITNEQLTGTKEKIRLFIEKNEIYIEETDKQLAFQYLEKLLVLKQVHAEFETNMQNLLDKYESTWFIDRILRMIFPKLSPKNQLKLERFRLKVYSKYATFKLGIIGKAFTSFEKTLNEPNTIISQIRYLFSVLSIRIFSEIPLNFFLQHTRKLAASANEVRSFRKRLMLSIKQVISGKA